jgi:hypothetical protein
VTAVWDPVSYRGKRYLENLLGLGLIAALLLIFFVYINRLAIAAEEAGVQQSLSILRQGVQIFMLGKMIDGERRFEKYDNGNPFAMLPKAPADYAGEYSARDGRQVPDGRWYFELDSRQAVYRFMNKPFWKDGTGEKEIRLSLRFEPAEGPLPLKLREAPAKPGEDKASKH